MNLEVRWSVAAKDDSTDALLDRVLGEYREMPGLALTIKQARRLWGCGAVTCRHIADVLVDHQVQFLQRDLKEHWDVLRHAQIADGAFCVLTLIEKWGVQAARH